MHHKSTRRTRAEHPVIAALLLTFWLLPGSAYAAYDDPYEGESYEPVAVWEDAYPPDDTSVDVVILTPERIEELVGPIALYPDDLLAIVLPASTYPLEIVQAARFLDALDTDPSLTPDPDWDEAVIALLNYPTVLRKLNDDLDRTWELGGAVLNQQQDVIAAIESFRDRAYDAGNLRSDDYQTVTYTDDVIAIEPASPEVIYVPYYEPRQVVIRQPEPVYYYYSDPFPVYYYPYPSGHRFLSGFFWGVTTAYGIGWLDRGLHVYRHDWHSHPYYGHRYSRRHYRRPHVNVYNNWYVHGATRHSSSRYRDGVRWRPRPDSGARPGGHYYRPPPAVGNRDRHDRAVGRQSDDVLASGGARQPRPDVRERTGVKPRGTRRGRDDAIRFRERPGTITSTAPSTSRPNRPSGTRPAVLTNEPDRQTGRKPAVSRYASVPTVATGLPGSSRDTRIQRKPAGESKPRRETSTRDTNTRRTTTDYRERARRDETEPQRQRTERRATAPNRTTTSRRTTAYREPTRRAEPEPQRERSERRATAAPNRATTSRRTTTNREPTRRAEPEPQRERSERRAGSDSKTQRSPARERDRKTDRGTKSNRRSDTRQTRRR